MCISDWSSDVCSSYLELMQAQTIVTAPLNPAYSSLNIAQAVLLLAWEHLMAADATPVRKMPLGGSRAAHGEELRAEQRRVRKEVHRQGRSRGRPSHQRKKEYK